ncbi:MAG: methylmalonyl Co-A mutase-associated GTPase MeaB [Chitinivibrionia bacterium]|nr:methylmalonyl Co-A mutase-associated GTPase MeaB [Chitinivibrionia bacterium]
MHEQYMERFFSGDPLAASRLMSIVERGAEEGEAVLDAIFPKVGRAYRIGVTGLTGAGKSSLINKLSCSYRREVERVGVVAVDPTSPFSGGALLGDRIRMSDARGDAGIFIRSVASRGSETGLSACANELADVLDAFGSDVIFLETIGVGQLEYKVRFSVHTTLVVLVPEAGDDIQSLKSGLMEIGDVFIVNKADRAHGDRYADDLRSMLELRRPAQGWRPLVVPTVAVKGGGIPELVDAIGRHKSFLERNGGIEQKRIEALRNRIAMVAEEKLKDLFWNDRRIAQALDALFPEVLNGAKSPYQAARELVAALSIGKQGG